MSLLYNYVKGTRRLSKWATCLREYLILIFRNNIIEEFDCCFSNEMGLFRIFRLKTAFVKALQQEQEIEQRLAQPCPSPDPPAPKPVPKAATPTRRVATPPAPPPQVPPAPTLTPTPPAPKLQEHPLVKLAESGKFSPHHAAAAALQQQLLRGRSRVYCLLIA